MADEPPPAKRQRQSSPTEDTTPSRSHIWKPFGDIVLQAEATQFRVNRDVLATQSPVFADMFSVPQPPGEPLVDGCPLVLLSGDTTKGWELLLGFLYGNPFEVEECLPFDVIAAMLRLGRKYGICTAEASAIRRIHWEFPTTLKTWSAHARFKKIQKADGMLFDLLNLVHEFGINTTIPALALACLHDQTLEKILNGVPRFDGSRVTLAPNIARSLIIGFQRVLAFQNKTYAWLDNDDVIPAGSCKQRSKCTKGRHALRGWLAWDEARDMPYFFGLIHWDPAWWDDVGICDA
ncbi:hypothetical protein FB45DRAFT_909052 [Roridomyces roridus]|uniref:BTB domain-containing protein n=1 Tax=Roridomyces roridus TaxID=1738132 RepID=A0AAD7BYR2_9AGAR|nr:hypothetical protein FB45DRAFT_909052 [Roridomyces roridus]